MVVSDIDPRAESMIPDGVVFTDDVEEVLTRFDLDALWVCTPQTHHRPIVEAALSREIAVLCEKPLAATLEDADAMLRAAQGHLLAVGHMLRFDLDYRAIAGQVHRGNLGRVVQLAVRRNCPAYEGRSIAHRTSVPVELAVHDLDVLAWLAGPIEAVFAEATSVPVVRADGDAVVGTAKLASGAVAALEHNWIMPDECGLTFDQRLEVVGTRGTAYLEGQPTSIYTGSASFSSAKYGPAVGTMPFGLLAIEDQTFLELVRGHAAWPLALEDARHALVAALAMERSLTSGRRVALSEVERRP